MQISGALLFSTAFGASVVSGAAIQPRASSDRVLVGLTGEKSTNGITQGLEPVKRDNLQARASSDRVLVGLTGEKSTNGITQGLEPVKKRDLEDRQVTAAVVSILGIVGTAALTEITTQAVDAAIDMVKNLSEWNEAREEFTKATVKGMMDKNPDPTNLVAAVCYNMAYKLETPANVDSTASLSFKLGNLHTNFDCMYIKAPNSFYTEGDGGYVNLAYDYSSSRCTFDQTTGDLTCK
ncbi:hypothetical protein PG991_013235 [Apiospora marii]|uniref:DUF7888 domain-containing protein n=1 Tax=Apiospora marii TaxID=335849 RepID=A0ABR1R5H2_9PEZI